MKYSIQEINNFLKNYPIKFQDIVLELRNLVFKLAPQAEERILWRGLSYYRPELGGPVKGGICGISIHEDAVQLGFIHGIFLPDPKKVLKGNRKYKRFLEIRSLEDTPWSTIENLIKASVELDPSKLG